MPNAGLEPVDSPDDVVAIGHRQQIVDGLLAIAWAELDLFSSSRSINRRSGLAIFLEGPDDHIEAARRRRKGHGHR